MIALAKSRLTRSKFWIQAPLTIFLALYYIHFALVKSLWYDEAITKIMASNSAKKILSNSVNGFDPYHGLYYILVHFLTLPFNHSLFSIRLISIIATLAGVTGIIALCEMILTREIGLFSALLFALSPAMLDYGTEARSPALVAAVVVWTTIFLIKFLDYQSKYKFYFFTVIIILNCYLSLFTILFWPLYFTCCYFSSNRKSNAKRLIQSLLLSVSAVVPLAYVTLGAAGRTDWIAQDYKTINSIAHFGGLPFRKSEMFGFNYVPIFLLIFWGVIALMVGRRWDYLRQLFSQRTIMMLLVWSLAPGPILIAVSLIRPMYLNRYIIASIPGLMMIFIVSLKGFSKRLTQNALIGVVILVSIFQAFNPTAGQRAKDNWYGVKSSINLNAAPGDSIVVDDPNPFLFADALADNTLNFELVKIQPSDLDPWTKTSKRVPHLADVAGRVWVVSLRNVSITTSEVLKDAGYRNVSVVDSFGGEKLWLYEKSLK